MTEDRTVFRIPEANMARLNRDMEKISRKSVKFGGPELPLFIFASEYVDDGKGHKKLVYLVSLDIGLVGIEGWSFVARLDHSPETGNIVRALPNTGVEIPERFRNCAPDCEHCSYVRNRRDTFVLHNDETNEFKQVGSSCITDFLGHDAKELGRLAEIVANAANTARACEIDDEGLVNRRYVNLPNYLVHCAASVRQNGWISAAVARDSQYTLEATRDDALLRYAQNHDITPADEKLAEDALMWAQSFADKDHLSDWEHNVLVIARDMYIEQRSCGLAASIVGIFHKNHTARPQSVVLANMEPLIALFERAGSRIKYPKININLAGTALVLSMAGPTASVPGSINVKGPKAHSFDQDAPWFGRILRDGTFKPSRTAPTGLDKSLLMLAADPAGVAASHGHTTGNCCFCNKGLTDERSKQVGYGATCAKNYNLPYPKMSEVA